MKKDNEMTAAQIEACIKIGLGTLEESNAILDRMRKDTETLYYKERVHAAENLVADCLANLCRLRAMLKAKQNA